MYMYVFHLILALIMPRVHCKTCFCDIIEGECETNCCCDMDCNNNHTEVFSSCKKSVTISNSFLCSRNESESLTLRKIYDLLCIVFDNFLERNLFSEPLCVSLNNCFNSSLQTYTFASFQRNQTEMPTYQKNNPLFAKFVATMESGLFTIPSSGLSMSCKPSPVKFLSSTSHMCIRHLMNFASHCASFLNYSTYFDNIEIYRDPKNLSSKNTLNFESIPCFVDGVTDDCRGTVYDEINQTCQNGVTAVTYSFTVFESSLIFAAVSFSQRNLTAADFPLAQSFSVLFQLLTINSSPIIFKPGHPGYNVNYPILSAVRQEINGKVFAVHQNKDPGLKLSLLRPSSTGRCVDSLSRLPILFGQNQVTGCTLLVSNNCSELAKTINYILDGTGFDAFNGTGVVFVGTYGDSNIFNLLNEKPQDWIKIIKENYPNSVTLLAGCANMALSSKYEILYTKSGDLSHPQHKIVAARYSYGKPQFLRYHCREKNCDYSIEISTSVNFIDITKPPIRVLKQPFQGKPFLSKDSFHPLIFDSDSLQ